MTTSESKGRFFSTKRIDSHNESNRELQCSNDDLSSLDLGMYEARDLA